MVGLTVGWRREPHASRILEMRIEIKEHNVKLKQGEENKLMDQPTIERTK